MKIKQIIGFNEYRMVEVLIGIGRKSTVNYIPYNEFVKKHGIKLIENYERSKRR